MARTGVDYCPEHWPEERWSEDARLMQEAGLTVVRMAEFAWSHLEPQPQELQFDWLDRAIAVMADAGIEVVLGTPTAAPPAWLVRMHPEILPVDDLGHRHHFGTRIHRCMSNPDMRQAATAITQAMVDHYKACQNVIGWQIDNELGSKPARCYCGHCAVGFREWLKRRYRDITTLNREWFTVFWSQEYACWEEVEPPRHTVYGETAHNPSRVLDWYRFCSDNIVDFQHEQIEVLRAASPRQFITHNLMGLHSVDFDHYDLAKELDFVSWDNYPMRTHALFHDVMRGMKQRNFWVMEQRCGATGWQMMSPIPRPGQVRMWTWQSVAHGADAVVYFRWRSCPGGTEQYWGGVLDHDGVPRRRYREIQQTGKELMRLAPILDATEIRNQVAIVNSYDQIWAYQIQPQALGRLDYWKIGAMFHEAFTRAGIGVDVLSLDADLDAYKLVVFPSLYLLTQDMAQRIAAYVESGGNVLIPFRTGSKGWNNLASELPLPGLLSEVAGIEIVEYDAMLPEQANGIRSLDGAEFNVSTWCDVLTSKTAQPYARYLREFYMGEAAVTFNEYGAGKAWYLGAHPEAAFCEALVRTWQAHLDLDAWPDLPDGVEVSWRRSDDHAIAFLLNLDEYPKKVLLHERFQVLLGDGEGCVLHNEVDLPACGVSVLLRASQCPNSN